MNGRSLDAKAKTQDRFTGPEEVPVVRRYVLAFVSVLVAFAVRYALEPLLGEELPLMFFVAASLIAAWYGGAVTGIIALLLGLFLAEHFFVSGKNPLRVHLSAESLQYVRYLFIASVGIILIEVLHRDRRRVHSTAVKLEREVELRKRTENALREAQAQLRRDADELEKQVQERTAQLNETVASLRDLLYQIGHNFRAPLRAIEGYSSILAMECATWEPSCQEHLRRISESARRMDDLVHDLFQYGRLGQMDIKLSNVSLQSVVDDVLKRQLLHDIEACKADVAVVAALPLVYGQQELLGRIVANLVENALKFVPPGVVPRVRLKAESRGPTVRLWVEDNGIGIDPRYHECIFGVFEYLHASDTKGGTGIGLAIVKQAVERLGGRTGVESQPGSGSRFWVDFQAARAEH